VANRDPEPRRGDQGAAPIAGRNVELERQIEDISVMQWMANTPHEVISDTINVSQSLVDALPQTKQVVI
jgi:oxalate decarboxylase